MCRLRCTGTLRQQSLSGVQDISLNRYPRCPTADRQYHGHTTQEDEVNNTIQQTAQRMTEAAKVWFPGYEGYIPVEDFDVVIRYGYEALKRVKAMYGKRGMTTVGDIFKYIWNLTVVTATHLGGDPEFAKLISAKTVNLDQASMSKAAAALADPLTAAIKSVQGEISHPHAHLDTEYAAAGKDFVHRVERLKKLIVAGAKMILEPRITDPDQDKFPGVSDNG